MSDFQQRRTAIAERFLQTAVIVDDQAHIDDSFRAPGPLKTPGRHTAARPPEETAQLEETARHSLDARILVDSFSERGLICAVMAPRPDTSTTATVALAARRADIVILDWQLDQDDGEQALSILKKILDHDEKDRLRLFAVYTGEQDIAEIGRTIQWELKGHGWEFDLCHQNVVLTLGHCCIVIYAKEGVSLTPDLKDRSISESDVAECLIGDFADMTTGLLPSIALTSLAAVRENAHKILDRFHAQLDAAFLAHRTCLPVPADSQREIVSQIADEVQAIMEDATASDDPAGGEAIEKWLAASAGPEKNFRFAESKELSLEQTVALVKEGFEKHSGPLKRKDFETLTAGFARDANLKEELDLQLAWMFNFRTVFNAPPPTLHLGTVLRKCSQGGDPALFLCMRPRCDSVRLKAEGAFLFLPLVSPELGGHKMIQLAVKTGANDYRLVSVCTKPSRWTLERFVPTSDAGGSVVAEEVENGVFFFTATDDTRFEWLGELKAQFAQRIAHRFASGLSRVAVDNTEWLRRKENLSD